MVLSNSAAAAAADGAAVRGLRWLRSRQRADGSWPVSDQVADGSWMSAVAALALAQLDAGDEHAVRGAEWLLSRESRGYPWLQRLAMRVFPDLRAVEQDSTLVGWPWTAGTTAWVEPTAHALLALKHLLPSLPRRRALDRIRQGELLLADRMCYGGGWNYGNRKVMGEELPPYPDTTALALMALHDRPSAAVTGASIARLRQMLAGSRSTLALALSVLALQLYGEDVAPLRAELRQRIGAGSRGADVRTLALALLALDERAVHFRVSRDA
jgi:hypothetical protein